MQLKEEWKDHGSHFLATKKFHDLYHLAERSCRGESSHHKLYDAESFDGESKDPYDQVYTSKSPIHG